MTKARQCICQLCHKHFQSTRPIEEVIAEADDLFPGLDVNDSDEMACLCEECFIKIAEFHNIQGFTKYIDKH